MIDSWWAGVRVSLVKCRVVLNPSHTTILLFSLRQSLSECEALAGWFSVNRRGESEFRVTEGAEMRASRVKANVRDTCCQVCVCACAYARMPVWMCVWLPYSPTINFKMPKSNCCSLLVLVLMLYFSLLSSLTDRGLKQIWRCSGTQGCLPNRKSPRSKSPTTPSSSQVCARLWVYD